MSRDTKSKGPYQVGEKEREHDLASIRKEIATLASECSIDPSTRRPYPVGMIEKAMAEAGFSVKPNKTAKSQVRVGKKTSHDGIRFEVLRR